MGGIILLVVSSLVLLRSPEALARQIFPYGDYKIYLHSELAEQEVMAAGNPLNEELKQEILSIDGVTDVITKRQSLHINYRANGIEAGGMCDILTEQNYSAVETALIEGTMPADSRSIIIDSHTSNRNNIGVGETVELISGKSTIPVTISGVFDNGSIPTDGHGTVPIDAPLEFAPERLFHELHPEITSFDYSWNIVSDPLSVRAFGNRRICDSCASLRRSVFVAVSTNGYGKEASEKWGVTPRRINYYCVGGRISGIIKFGRMWMIPRDAQKPTDPRKAEQLEGRKIYE